MSKLLISALAGAAVALPAMTIGAATASADHESRYKVERKYKYDRRYSAKKRNWRVEEEYAARAENLDPAGDYKGYPNWARVALSPKYDRGFR